MNKYLLKSISSAVIVASVMAISLPALADSVEDANRFVKMCDTDKDGMVSKAEVMKRAADMMKKMEADKSGMVDAKKTIALILELQRGDVTPSARPVMMSKADMMKKLETAFDKVDAKKAGMLDKKQAEAFLRELMKSDG